MSAPVLLTMFRAGLRIVGAADRAVSQKLRDADVVFPANPKLPFDPAGMTIDAIRQAVEGDAKLKAWLTTQGLTPAYQQLVTAGQPPDAETQFLVNEAINVYFDNQVPGGTSPGHAFERAQETRLEQWLNDPNEPVSPTARFALVLVDVAAEFVAVNPGLVARGSNGEQLVSAFAGRISQLIPDDEKFGPKQRLGGRLLGVILRAGLETATQNRDIIASEKQNQDLIDAIATPIIAQFDGITDISDELQWEDIVDAVVGPAASAAFQVIADNQTAFLGSGFAPGTLLGALTGQLARTIAEDGLADTFSQGGAVALYQAALGVIVDQPGLVAPGGTARDGFIRDLIRDFGTVLRQNPVIGAGERQDFGLALATAALNAFRGNAAQLLGLGDSPLEKVAS
ncbi:MAG: hypothetical protein LJE68_15420, partial [Rhodobacter sp.]|nr:hypothetical protein [Rhodobacter sp.]